jgi:integrase
MAIRQKGNKWQVDVTVAGQRSPRVSADTKAEAQRIEADFKAKMLAGVPADLLVQTTPARNSKATGTLHALLEATHRSRWVDTKGEATAVHNGGTWADALGAEFLVSDLTPAIVSEVCDGWARDGNKGATINRKLAALNVMLKVAEERGMLDKLFRLPRRKEYEGRLRYYSDAEVTSLLDHAEYDPWLYRLFVVAVETGMRLGELSSLTVRDIDLKHRTVNLGATKGNKRRSLPMTKRAFDCLFSGVYDKADHALVFPEYLNSRHISRAIAAWKRDLGLPATDEACFHTFRHTTCSRLVQRGVPINVVMKFMGHTVIETTMRYAQLAPNSLDLARNALEGN